MGGMMIPSFLRTPNRRIRPRYLDDPNSDAYGPTLVPRIDEPQTPAVSDAVYRYGRDDRNGPPGMAGIQPIPNYDPRTPGRMVLLGDNAGSPPIAAPPAPIYPRFDPDVVPAQVPGLPGGMLEPRRPTVTTDLKGYVHDIGQPIGPPRAIPALPAGIDLSGGAPDPGGYAPPPPDLYDQIGVAHAARLDPSAAAAAELGPERKLTGWAKALGVAVAGLEGMQGRGIPEEVSPTGRHRIYQAELDRRTRDIADRYNREDDRLLEPARLDAARQQAELGQLQLEQARANIDYTNRRNRGELTPDQVMDNRRQILNLGAPVTDQDVKLFGMPQDWVGKPIPGQGPKPVKADPTRYRDVPDASGQIHVMRIGDDGKLYPAEYGTGGEVVGSRPARRDPTAKPRARASFLSTFGTSDEGKSVYNKSYSDALAGAVEPGMDVELTPAGIDSELTRLQTRIRALDDAGRAGPGIAGDVAAMDPEAAQKEQNQLRKRYQSLANAKHRADVEARKAVDDAAGRKFDETYTGEDDTEPGGGGSGDFSGYSKADFDAQARQHGLTPGSPAYNQAYQTFLAGGGSDQ